MTHRDVSVAKHSATIRGSWTQPAPLHRSVLQHATLMLYSKPMMEPLRFWQAAEFTHPRATELIVVEFMVLRPEDKNISVSKTFTMTIIWTLVSILNWKFSTLNMLKGTEICWLSPCVYSKYVSLACVDGCFCSCLIVMEKWPNHCFGYSESQIEHVECVNLLACARKQLEVWFSHVIVLSKQVPRLPKTQWLQVKHCAA